MLQFEILLFFFAEVVVSPPFVFLSIVKALLRSDFAIAAQNCWVRKGGAFTGEIRYVWQDLVVSVWLLALMFLMVVQIEVCGLAYPRISNRCYIFGITFPFW